MSIINVILGTPTEASEDSRIDSGQSQNDIESEEK